MTTVTVPTRVRAKEEIVPLLKGWDNYKIDQNRCYDYCCPEFKFSHLETQYNELLMKVSKLIEERGQLEIDIEKLQTDLLNLQTKESDTLRALTAKRQELADFKVAEQKKIQVIIDNFINELTTLRKEIVEQNSETVRLYKKQREFDVETIINKFKQRDEEYNKLLETLKTKLAEYSTSLNSRNDAYLRDLENKKNQVEATLNKMIEDRNIELVKAIQDLNTKNANEIAKTKSEYDAKVATITQQYNTAMENIKKETASKNQAFATLEASLVQNAAIAKKRKEDMQAFYDKEIVTIKAKIAANDVLLVEILNEMNGEFQKRKMAILTGANFDKNKITSLVDGKIESYLEMYDKKKQVATLDFAQRKKALIDGYNKKIEDTKKDIFNNINVIEEKNAIIYSELNDINSKYKEFSLKSTNELDGLSKVYQENVDKYNSEYKAKKAVFDKELQDAINKLEAERMETIRKHNAEVNEILKKFETDVIQEETLFFSTSKQKRLELAKLVSDLDDKATKLVMDKQNKILKDITQIKNNYDSILSQFQKERSELKTKLENADWDADVNLKEYNKMVNDESLTGNFSKIIQENENTSNYALYGLSLTGVVLLILILTKKKSKSK
jgi:hypothetical protein